MRKAKTFINKMNIIPLIIVLLSAAACSVSKDVRVDHASLPAAYRNAASSDTGSVASVKWEQFFTDQELQILIARAITKNYDIQVAIKNIEEAQLLLKQAKWGQVPQLGLQVSASSVRPSDNSLNGLNATQSLNTNHVEDYSAAAALSWEADIWGKIRSQKKGARAAFLQSLEAQKLVQTDLVAGVSKGYYNLLMLDEQLRIARRNLALNDSTIRMIRLQYDAGQVTALGVQQAEAQQMAAAQLVPLLEQQINIQETALSVLTGSEPQAVERNARLNEMALPAGLAAGIPAEMIGSRPDVKASELELTKANARVGIAKAGMYPTLTITASGGVNAFKASNWFNIPASLFGMVAGGITQPLLQRRQLRTQYEMSKIEREKSVLRFRQSVLYAVGDVSNALISIEKLKEQERISAGRVSTLKQATSNANMLFQNGMATYLEVITAQSSVLQTELELAAIKRSQLIAVVDLYRSLGGGWQ